MLNEEVNQIYYSGKEDKFLKGEALEILLNNENKHLEKGSTGIGGTRAIIVDQSKSWIIVSPNTGMIKSKENKRKEYNTSSILKFRYYKSDDTWHGFDDILNKQRKFIVNTTPDQLVNLRDKNPGLFQRLSRFNIFVDESHLYTPNAKADLRPKMGYFWALLEHEWLGPKTFSTATPSYKYFDVPAGLRKYKVINDCQQPKPLAIAHNIKDGWNYIFRELVRGNKVIVFSNNIDHHKKQFDEYRTANLVGKTLRVKLMPFDKGNDELTNDIYENDVIFLSSSYFTGADIEIDASICIMSDMRNQATTIGIADGVQCYGRCRHQVKGALYVNALSNYVAKATKTDVDKALAKYYRDITYYTEEAQLFGSHLEPSYGITPHGYCNRAELGVPLHNTVVNYELTNEDVFKETLEGYGFVLSQYEPIEIKAPRELKINFKGRILNLMKRPLSELGDTYDEMRDEIITNKKEEKGHYSYKLCFEYLTALIIKEALPFEILQMLDKGGRVQPHRFYYSLDLYLRVNGGQEAYYTHPMGEEQLSQIKNYIQVTPIREDVRLIREWVFLYAIYKVKNNIFDEYISRKMRFYDLCANTEVTKSLAGHKYKYREAMKLFKDQMGPTHQEEEKASEIIREAFKTLENEGSYTNFNGKDYIKNKLVGVLGYLFNGCLYEPIEKKYRVYTQLTNLPSAFRPIIPWKFVVVDISSANPQFVDGILGTSIAFDVYNNIQQAEKITRDGAKIKYNMYLNNHKFTTKQSKAAFMKWGYPEAAARELAGYTATMEGVNPEDNRAQFYFRMVQKEEEIIQIYQNVLGASSERFHDAVVLPKWAAEGIVIPLKVNGFVFQEGFLNCDEKYNGMVSPTNIESNESILRF